MKSLIKDKEKEKNLQRQIKIVFDKEYFDAKNNKKRYAVNSNNEIIYDTFETLKDIYANLGNNEILKKKFIDVLAKKITERTNGRIYTNHLSELCVFTLTKLGQTKKVINEINKFNGSFYGFSFPNIIGHLLEEPYRNFSNEELDLLYEKFTTLTKIKSEHTKEVCQDVLNYLASAKYANLKKEVKSVNTEINIDKQIVKEKINYLGLDEKYSKLLDEIDKYMVTDVSEFVNSGMIGNLRVFTIDIIIDLARRISRHKKEEIPKEDGQQVLAASRKYLENNLELGSDEERFINFFMRILHGEGGHSMTSEKEYFRLARNIAIEIALFLLSKFEKKYK